jgi:hypothetical protein
MGRREKDLCHGTLRRNAIDLELLGRGGSTGPAHLGPRYEIPAYFGHNGWIALDVAKECDWNEVKGLALQSYRHFALKRMLQILEKN